jgi:hypothetical protein
MKFIDKFLQLLILFVCSLQVVFLLGHRCNVCWRCAPIRVVPYLGIQ